jgi:hypothetical protein
MRTIQQLNCKVFEDNSGALEMGNMPKMRPRTKHICVRMHHFREHVRKGAISIHKIPSRYQLADIATKPQPVALFEEQRESLLQWWAETATVDKLQQVTNHLRACDVPWKSRTKAEAIPAELEQEARLKNGCQPGASLTGHHTGITY